MRSWSWSSIGCVLPIRAYSRSATPCMVVPRYLVALDRTVNPSSLALRPGNPLWSVLQHRPASVLLADRRRLCLGSHAPIRRTLLRLNPGRFAACRLDRDVSLAAGGRLGNVNREFAVLIFRVDALRFGAGRQFDAATK